MSGIGFTEEQEMFRKGVERFAQKELAPDAKKRIKSKVYPSEILKRLGEVELIGVNCPEKYGGQPADWVTVGIETEELAKVDPMASFFIMMPKIYCATVELGSEEVQEEWIPQIIKGDKFLCLGVTEPSGGNDVVGMRTKAVKKGGDYIINGEKTSVSAGMWGDGILLWAKTDLEAGARGITSFLIPSLDVPEVTRSVIPDMGWHPLGRAVVSFEDLHLPEKYRLGEEGKGFYWIASQFIYARILVSLLALGIAQSAMDTAISYAKQREAFGQVISKYQGVSFKIADNLALIEAGRWLCYRALSLKDQGLPHNKEASMCKMFCPTAALQATHDALLIHGNFGYSEEYPLEQQLRDVLATEIMDGTPEMQKLIVAREVFGKDFV